MDAENAARAVLAGRATAIPKEQSGVAEALRIACIARRSAVKAKTQAINQLRALLVSAPADIRARLWRSKPEDCVAICAHLEIRRAYRYWQPLYAPSLSVGVHWPTKLTNMTRRWMPLRNSMLNA